MFNLLAPIFGIIAWKIYHEYLSENYTILHIAFVLSLFLFSLYGFSVVFFPCYNHHASSFFFFYSVILIMYLKCYDFLFCQSYVEVSVRLVIVFSARLTTSTILSFVNSSIFKHYTLKLIRLLLLLFPLLLVFLSSPLSQLKISFVYCLILNI